MFISCKKCGATAKHAYFNWQSGKLICKCGNTILKVTQLVPINAVKK